MLPRLLFALPLIAVLAATAGAQPQAETKPEAMAAAGQPENDPVVARINGMDIHRSEVLAQIARLPAQVRQTPPEQLMPMMVEAVINSHLVQAAAEKANLGNDPEVQQRLEQAKKDIVRTVFLERLVEKNVSDAKLHELYEADLKNLPQEEEINARHILVKTEDEAKAIIAQLEKGADFGKLAADKSIDPAGKGSGGDLGWFTKDQMVPEFANAAFALKKGEITKAPVKTRFGWHVIKLIDRRAAPPPSFEEMKPRLIAQVQNDLIGNEVKQLRAAAKIELIGPDGKPVPAEDKPALTPMPAAKSPAPASTR